MKKAVCLSLVGLAAIAGGGAAAWGQAPSGAEIMRHSHLARYYPGEDMQARVIMRLVSREGREPRSSLF